MREHKYKFWDKHNKIWVGPYTLKQLADEDQFSSDREWKPICSKWEWFECVEYTGLKDCKGTEIYEGDIVKSGKTIIGTMVFEAGCFVLKGVSFYSIREEHLEVIGNIYENPELVREGNGSQ